MGLVVRMSRARGGAVAVVLGLAVFVAASTATPAAGSQACGKPGYSYAGLQSADRAHGVRATLTALAAPQVQSGHVAAWVGVGGPGAGRNGADAWLQVGLSGFPGEPTSKLYFESNRPGVGPAYTELVAAVAAGTRYRVAVLETARADWWRVWVNGKPVSAPVHLPGSSGRWRPIATAETWDGGRRACNRFQYRFDGVSVAGARGGSWRRFVDGHRFEDPGYRVVSGGAGTFLARASG